MPLKPETRSAPFSPSDTITEGSELGHLFTAGARPASEWAVGPEMEWLGYRRGDLSRISPGDIQAVIEGFSAETSSKESEGDFVVEATLSKEGLEGEPGGPSFGGRITLEPGGQLEFSGAHNRSLAALDRIISGYAKRLDEIAGRLNISFIATGFDPLRRLDEQRWVPKKRYEIMRPYLKGRGARGLDMMTRTSAMQVNLDYCDLEDMRKKFLLANRLGPIAAAIFANSPFQEGKLSGYKTTRYAVWLETDPDRAGLSPLALGSRFSIERYLDYVRSVPMFFIRRDGQYIDMTGVSFGRFLARGERQAIFQDFMDHLSTIFTEARLKPHVEQRSMDSGSVEVILSALAFWKGLLYDPPTLDDAIALAPDLDAQGFAALQLEVARHGLEAKASGVCVMDVARAAVELARSGLRSLAADEVHYLDVLEERVVKEQISTADILMRNFQGSWNGSIEKAVDYLRVAG